MIEHNLKILNKNIGKICSNCGRDISEVKLIAVSKTKPISEINEALNFGQVDFGENKAKELKEKAGNISKSVNWHFIGHLQTNKVKLVIPFVTFLHSVESFRLVEEVNKIAAKLNKIQNILIEFNTSGEDSKFGLQSFDEGFKLVEYCSNLKNINVSGLMTMAPFTNNESVIRNSFSMLRNYFEKINSQGFKLQELSMGMSNDYRIAIEEGSTMIRIGTAIFGNRNYN